MHVRLSICTQSYICTSLACVHIYTYTICWQHHFFYQAVLAVTMTHVHLYNRSHVDNNYFQPGHRVGKEDHLRSDHDTPCHSYTYTHRSYVDNTILSTRPSRRKWRPSMQWPWKPKQSNNGRNRLHNHNKHVCITLNNHESTYITHILIHHQPVDPKFYAPKSLFSVQ
jgi:hypothetical protein